MQKLQELKRKTQNFKKKKKKRDKKVLLSKTKFNSIGIQIPNALSNSYINCAEFVIENSALKEYDNMKLYIQTLKTSVVHQRC